mgnify:CR=1 FL=1
MNLGQVFGDVLSGTAEEQKRYAQQMAAPQTAAGNAAVQALGGAAAPKAPGIIGALGGPAGIALGGIGAILGGISAANEKARQGQIQGLQAGAEGAQRMGQAQAAGLAQLMQGYQGILR